MRIGSRGFHILIALVTRAGELVSKEELDALTHRLAHINPRAAQVKNDFGKVAISEVLDLRGFNLNDKLELDPDFLAVEEAEKERAERHARGDHRDDCEQRQPATGPIPMAQRKAREEFHIRDRLIGPHREKIFDRQACRDRTDRRPQSLKEWP